MSVGPGKPAEPDLRHLPLPDADSEPFWAAAAEHRLLARRCERTGRAYLYPRERVPGTLSDDTTWVELSGAGTIYTYTVVRQAAARAFRDRVPYVLALIDLDEGARMMANVEADPDEVNIGQRVHVAWREEGDMTLPVFVPDGD